MKIREIIKRTIGYVILTITILAFGYFGCWICVIKGIMNIVSGINLNMSVQPIILGLYKVFIFFPLLVSGLAIFLIIGLYLSGNKKIFF